MRKGSHKSTLSKLVSKYKPKSNTLFTPVRKSSRNNSISSSRTPLNNQSRKVLKFEISPSPKKQEVKTPTACKNSQQRSGFSIFKSHSVNKPTQRKSGLKPKNYIEKVKYENTLLSKEPTRIEMVKKKNAKRKSMIEKTNTINSEIHMNLDLVLENKEIEQEVVQVPQKIFNPSPKLIIEKSEIKHPLQESLKLINEVM